MSWWSDGEPFDEYDPPWCENCDGGDSYEECQRCCDSHAKECVYDSRRDYEIDKALEEMERNEAEHE